MQSLIPLAATMEAINRGFCHYPEYRLPVILAIMGRRSEAHAAISRAVDEPGERRDAAAQELRNFAAIFNAETPQIDSPACG